MEQHAQQLAMAKQLVPPKSDKPANEEKGERAPYVPPLEFDPLKLKWTPPTFVHKKPKSRS